MRKHSIAVVSIIGRTNVGKSTLFNTLLEKRCSIVSPLSGTTRDRNYKLMMWRGISFYLVDTGGLDIKGKEEIEANVIKQAQKAIGESTIILFLVDSDVDITKDDRQVSQYLRKNKKTIILAVNKVDSPRKRKNIVLSDFLRLGFKNPMLISAHNGSGTGDLLDEIVKKIPASLKKEQAETKKIKLAVLGKPNVGKSSFVNAVLGEERVIVTAQPHTTRDPQNITFEYQGNYLEIIDTAGVRKIRKIDEVIEKESVNRTMAILKKANIVFLVLDVSQKISQQDAHLAGLIKEAKKCTVIIANKWDLISEHDKKIEQQYQDYIKRHLPHLSWAPIVFVSALRKNNIEKSLEVARFSFYEYNKKIDDQTLAQFMKRVQVEHLPSRRKNSLFPKIYSLRQISVAPPTFVLKIRRIDSLHPSYLRFLENRLRQRFVFQGSPIYIGLKDFKFT